VVVTKQAVENLSKGRAMAIKCGLKPYFGQNTLIAPSGTCDIQATWAHAQPAKLPCQGGSGDCFWAWLLNSCSYSLLPQWITFHISHLVALSKSLCTTDYNLVRGQRGPRGRFPEGNAADDLRETIHAPLPLLSPNYALFLSTTTMFEELRQYSHVSNPFLFFFLLLFFCLSNITEMWVLLSGSKSREL
jgi:hypothetical protein